MKIRTTLLALVFILSYHFSFSQQKKRVTSKPKSSEIDRLIGHYKNIPSVILSSVNSVLHADVAIEYNSTGKGYSVTLTGEDTCQSFLECGPAKNFILVLPRIEQLFSILKNQKERSGYTHSYDLSSTYSDVYVKGNMYTTFTRGMLIDMSAYGKPTTQTFSICTEDFSRAGGPSSRKLEF